MQQIKIICDILMRSIRYFQEICDIIPRLFPASSCILEPTCILHSAILDTIENLE